MNSAPPPPATCSISLCATLPGYCPTDNDDESANSWTKWNPTLGDTDLFEPPVPLEKQENEQAYDLVLAALLTLQIIAAAYPRIDQLYVGRNADAVLLDSFLYTQGDCVGPAVAEASVPSGSRPLPQGTFQTEHVMDVS